MSAPQPPVAMFRGIRPCWYLYDGSPGAQLAAFVGDHDQAHTEARKWCADNSFYLSPWSDADDRVPNSECICPPEHGDMFTAGCPMHRPKGGDSA